MNTRLDLLHISDVQLRALRSAHDYCSSFGFCFATLVTRWSYDEELQNEVLRENHMNMQELLKWFYTDETHRFDMLDALMQCYPDALIPLSEETCRMLHAAPHDPRDLVLVS